jgi:hypothetical protein
MNCRGCEGDRLEPVYRMDPLPIAGDFKDTRQEALDAERFPLTWQWCADCGLVNVDPALEPDWSRYSYRASQVPALVRHHAEFARFLNAFGPTLHVEIGGNDGVLRVPWEHINVDPSDAFAWPGYNEPFTLELAKRIGRKADLITSSNSMAHFTGLSDALAGVRYLLHRDGVFVMEVHDLDATVAGGQWDTIYHEHAVEWSESSLRNVGRLHGLRLTHVWRLPLHGGLLRAVFVPDMPKKPKRPKRPDLRTLQRAYDEATAPDLPPGSVAYGAAARATVYLDHTRPDVVAVIDGSSRRHGRYVPGVGLPILSPEDFGSPPAALITAIGHEADIKARHPGYDRWVEWHESSS